jgi:hypothetical protein
MACPPSSGTPPPLAPVQRLDQTSQQIGADLHTVVAMWAPAAQSRLVRAQLLRADGSVIVRASTCGANSLALAVEDLHPGDHLTLVMNDTLDGALHYDITVVAPDSMPQPPAKVTQDWLAATWRLAAAGPGTNLDSITRVAKASETSFGAQRVLGAVATDTPF